MLFLGLISSNVRAKDLKVMNNGRLTLGPYLVVMSVHLRLGVLTHRKSTRFFSFPSPRKFYTSL